MALAMLISSGNFIFGSQAVDSLPPSVVAFWRSLIATLCMLPFFLRAEQSIFGYFRQHGLKALWLTLTGVVLPAWLIYLSLDSDTLIDLAVGYTMIPVMTVLFAALLLGERLRWMQSLGLVLALLGALVFAFKGNLENLRQFNPHIGFLWMLGCCVTRGLYMVLLKKWDMKPASDGGLFVLLFAGAVLLAPLFVDHMTSKLHPADYSWQLWGSIIFIGVGMGALYLHLISFGTSGIGAVKASLFTYLLPIFVTAESVLFLGAEIQRYQIAAAAVVVVGVFLVSWFREAHVTPEHVH
jgi:drug/metabolite transporter (DMT)-like permease